MKKTIKPISAFFLARKRDKTLKALHNEFCGAATADVLMPVANYKREDDFERDIVKPLIEAGHVCRVGVVITITDSGLLAVGATPDVPTLAAA